MEFNSSLTREKFVIKENGKEDGDADSVIALSNRMVVNLVSESEMVKENYVVRAQNMHSCVRLAAMIVKEFQDKGPIMSRNRPYNWKHGWTDVTKGFERDWNPDIWGVVYNKGRVIFEDGERHPFLDIIEQCDIKNKGEYSQSIQFAEDAFKQAGKEVTIDYDSNIALVVAFSPQEAKCGVILRSAQRTTTFNFTAKPRANEEKIKISNSLTVSAAFLEGIQLAFQVGMANKKREYELFEKYSDEDRKGQRSTERVAALSRAIDQYERMFDVTFRPERPSFPQAISDAEDVAHKLLQPQIQEMLESGTLDANEWVE